MTEIISQLLSPKLRSNPPVQNKGLAWIMIRYARRGFWFIDTDVDKGKCGDGDGDHPGEFWHDKAEGCVKLMWKNEKNYPDYMPGDVVDKLFANDGDYNLDRKKTFENSYDCFVDNGGKVGDMEQNKDMTDTSIPKCYFGIEVVSGKRDQWDIVLDGKLPGQEHYKNWEPSDKPLQNS